MTRTALALIALGAAVVFRAPVACADGVRDAVDAQNRAFLAAFQHSNTRAISELYTENARVIAPGAEVASGRAAIAAFWQKTIDGGVKDVKLTTENVESAGDLAYEDGNVAVTGADGKTSPARYVVVWKREGGQWKLHRDIWNAAP